VIAVELLALAGSPVQTALAAAIIVALFAPRLLPPLGRLAGRLLRREIHRRLGIELPEQSRPRRNPQASVEVLQPDAPVTTLRADHQASLASQTARKVPPREYARTPWGAVVVVSAAVAVLLWYLLHPR
jgi:hypothetical protein